MRVLELKESYRERILSYDKNKNERKFWKETLTSEIWRFLVGKVTTEENRMLDGKNQEKIEITVQKYFRCFCNKSQCKNILEINSIPSRIVEYACTEECLDGLSEELKVRIEKIYLRVIIEEMNILYENQKLIGNDKKEKYTYFKNKYLLNDDYLSNIMSLYPGMYTNISEEISDFERYIIEICENYRSSIKEVSRFFNVRSDNRIQYISRNMSDSHKGGKFVKTIILDNGEKLIYKPRSSQNELLFYKIVNFIYGHIGLETKEIKIVDYDEYCWCEYISPAECKDEQEIHNFYKRIGVLLFTAYLFGTGDLHAENLIACGEFPILVDLENLVKQSLEKEEPIIERFKKSVLFSGIMPMPHWNKNGNGVNLGALSYEENQKLPVKVPVICDYETTDMHVEYIYPTLETADNVPFYQGKRVNYKNYEADIIDGFNAAYEIGIALKKEIAIIIEAGIEKVKNRIIFENTQKYAMLITSSFHPDLLMNTVDREIFLNLIRKGRSFGNEEIISKEIESMLKRDIPYFSQKGNEREIKSDDLKTVYAYTEKTPREIISENIKNLNPKDKEWQLWIIKTVFEMCGKDTKLLINRESVETEYEEADAVIYIKTICQHIMDTAIYTDDSIGWIAPKLIKNSWVMNKTGIYLYDGIAGICIFLHYLAETDKNAVSEEYLYALDRELFRYTDEHWRDINFLDKKTGIFEGEGSIIYAYLLLYNLTQGKKYLKYAKKHCILLRRNVEVSKKNDLLEGNAGAVFAYIMMYEATGKNVYRNWAQEAANLLIDTAVNIDGGMAWKTKKSLKPLLGVSHGTSGIAWAFAKLYSITHKTKYQEIVRGALIYENKNYDTEISDWKDYRDKDAGKDHQISWCHGGGGILLARKNIMELCDDLQIIEMCRRDININLERIMKKKQRNGMCLCHGTSGNYEIIRECTQGQFRERVPLQKISKLLFQERTSPGFMSGLSGIAYTVLRMKRFDYPNILKLEINHIE